MTLLSLVILALIQGVTEWLPISSSAHLALFPALTGQADQGPLIDAMAHLGTLFAALVYFRTDVGRAILGGLELVRLRRPAGPALANEGLSKDAKLALFILIATPPGVIAGAVYALSDWSDALRNPMVIAWATIVFGALLWAADALGKQIRTEGEMTVKDAALIGLSQACAFVPGVSRSGVTMTAARALGFSRTEAARFAMLLGMPLLAAVGVYAFLELAQNPPAPGALRDGVLVAGLSFMAALVAIWGLMRWLSKMSFLPFVIYRFALGAALLIWVA